jgi:predicted RNase H-like HicB family nuclease
MLPLWMMPGRTRPSESGFPIFPAVSRPSDDVDEALRNAKEALALYAEAETKEGRRLPVPRTLSALRDDPRAATDLRDHMVALIALNVTAARAAE